MEKKEPKKLFDIRQVSFLRYYLDPKSDSFSNAYKSAIKAGYKKEYAENITHIMPKWLSESLGNRYLVEKAEKNLKNFLEKASEKVKADITKFVLERLNKKKYSQRQELGFDEDIIAGIKIEIVKPKNEDSKPKINDSISEELPRVPEEGEENLDKRGRDRIKQDSKPGTTDGNDNAEGEGKADNDSPKVSASIEGNSDEGLPPSAKGTGSV